MSFGVTEDLFGLGDTKWRPQTGSKDPTAAGEAQVADSNGDIVASTVHGNAKAWSQSFKVVAGDSGTTVLLSTKVKLGQLFSPVGDSALKAIVTKVDIATTNTAFPLVTVSTEQFFGDTSGNKTYTIPGVTALKALKRAQGMGLVVAGVNRLNSCNLSASLQTVHEPDSLGVFVQSAGYAGRAESTGEAVNAAAAPAITADSGWTAARTQSEATDNRDYGKGSLTVFKNILPDS